jgi:hypothetical protein
MLVRARRIEAAADFTDVNQLAALVNPQHQSPKMLPASTGLSESADYSLLLKMGFDLQPAVAPAAGDILARAVFGDHAFEYCIEECQTMAAKVTDRFWTFADLMAELDATQAHASQL